MAAISALLEPVAPAPANTPRVAEKSQGKNAGGFEHPAFNKVLKEHSEPPKVEAPKAKETAAPATPVVADATSEPSAEPVASTPAAALPPETAAPPLEPVTASDQPPQIAAKPLKLQALLNAAPTPSTEGEAAVAEAPVPTTALPEIAAAPKPSAAEAAPADPVHLVAPEAFLRWLDTLKSFADPAARQPTATLSSTAASSDRLPAPVAALLAAAAPTLEALASQATTTSTLPTSTPSADHTPFGLTVAALNTLPTTASPVAEAARLSTPLAMESPDWPQQLGEQIRWRLGEGIQEARIEISPRELGAVDVRLSMDEQGLRVHLSAEQAKTRELLQNELPRLRESLQQGGILLADAQVGREAPGREGAHQQGAHGAFKSQHAPGHGRDDDDARVVHVGGWRTRVGLLDDYA